MQYLPHIEIKQIFLGSHIPTRATDGSAGYDLVVPTEPKNLADAIYVDLHGPGRADPMVEGGRGVAIQPGHTVRFRLGFAIHIKDPNWEAQIRARSGLAVKRGLIVPNGVGTIDSDYQGEVMVALHNIGHVPQVIRAGDRIAQLVFAPVGHPRLLHVSEFSDGTERGDGSFGSTGGAQGLSTPEEGEDNGQ